MLSWCVLCLVLGFMVLVLLSTEVATLFAHAKLAEVAVEVAVAVAMKALWVPVVFVALVSLLPPLFLVTVLCPSSSQSFVWVTVRGPSCMVVSCLNVLAVDLVEVESHS